MPSKEFLRFQSGGAVPPALNNAQSIPQGMAGPGGPGGPIGPGGPGGPGGFPGGGVPMLPEDWVPPEPVIPEGCEGGKVTINGVDGLHVTKPGLRDKSCFLHIHGGGFTIGTAMGCADILAHFIEQTRLEGYSVEYGLAPKHVFPKAVEDCVAFYKGLLDLGYTRIVVGGESAGAGLTLSLTLALKDLGLPLPAALWCSSPIDDCRYCHKEVWKQDMFTDMCDAIWAVYAPGGDPEDPLLSPIFGDFTGFPPLFIQTGGDESLAAGAVRLAAKAAKADVEVLFHYGKGMGHTYAMSFGAFPEATNAMKEITTFVCNVLDIDEG